MSAQVRYAYRSVGKQLVKFLDCRTALLRVERLVRPESVNPSVLIGLALRLQFVQGVLQRRCDIRRDIQQGQYGSVQDEVVVALDKSGHDGMTL